MLTRVLSVQTPAPICGGVKASMATVVSQISCAKAPSPIQAVRLPSFSAAMGLPSKACSSMAVALTESSPIEQPAKAEAPILSSEWSLASNP